MVKFTKRSPNIELLKLGSTPEHRDLLAAKVSDGIRSPQGARAKGKVVVLLLGNIHSGECAGKESLLMLLRELSKNKNHPLLKKLVLLIVPNYNADGNERVGKLHRPGQLGPAVMGRRENAQQLDLNRDFIKMDAPETRHLVRFVSLWQPHVFIDLHTTNGSEHRYALTYDVTHNPAAPQSSVRLLRDTILPEVTKNLQTKHKTLTNYYGNFNKQKTRWSTFGHEPRYSTEYMGMRGSLAILSEAYSYVSYRRRIEATSQFVRECLNSVAKRSDQVRAAVKKARTTLPKQLPVQAKLAKYLKPTTIEGYKTVKGKKKPHSYSVEFWGRFQPTRKVEVPAAYVIPFEQSRVVDRLRMHGLRIHKLARSKQVQLSVTRGIKVKRGRVFQRHRLVTLSGKATKVTRQLKRDTYIVPLNQPLARLAVYMLDPASDDSLTTWNFFDHSLIPNGEFPVAKIDAKTLEGLALSKPIKHVVPAQRIDFDHVYGPRRVNFSGSFLIASWQPKGSKYTRTWAGRRVAVDAETGAMEPVRRASRQGIVRALAKLPGISSRQAARLARGRLTNSPKGNGSIISIRNNLYFVDPKAGTAKQLTKSRGRKRFASFSADGKKVAYVEANNLWVVQIASAKPRQLTTKGDATHFYGVLDWVYQEEIYGRGRYKAFWWSPDSNHIAFLGLDETPVHKYTVADQIPVRQSLSTTAYPKSGDPLPKVSLGIAAVNDGSVRWVKDAEYAKEKDLLIVRVGWRPNGSHLVYQVQNRVQTWLDLRELAINDSQSKSQRILRESSKAWVSVLGQPRWMKDGSFLWLSERTGTKQIYRVKNGKTEQLTRTKGDVSSIAAVGAKERWLYFHAYDKSSIAQQVFRVDLVTRKTQRLSQYKGHHVARFNKDCTHWICYRSGVHQPVKVELYRSNGRFIRSIAPNLTDHLKYYAIQKPQRVRVPTRDKDFLDAWLIRPANFDPKKKYPVLCYVYSGPQVPTVQNRWPGTTYMWHQMLAQRGYCIWLCDNRSATRRGANKAWPIHRQMGKQELEDIEDGLTWLKSHSWIDGKRIGIWGWSYGGYMTSYALTHSRSFKMGIAGAPVTDWKNYDAIYTERYMGLPQKNKKGYEVSSVLTAAKNMHGKLLLIHGTQDDNVHLSNTMQLVYALQRAGKKFELMLYPKNRHSIFQPQQSRHMRKLMTRFVLEEL